MSGDENPDHVPEGTPSAGEDICRHCKGTGEVDEEQCPECGGTGKITAPIGGG